MLKPPFPRPQAGGFYTWKHENSTIQPPAERDRDLTRFIVTLWLLLTNPMVEQRQGSSVFKDFI